MSICTRLPQGFLMETSLNKVSISLTMETVGHGLALMEAMNVAILPILKTIEKEQQPEPDPYLWSCH